MMKRLLLVFCVGGSILGCQKQLVPKSYLYIYNSKNQITDSIPTVDGTLEGALPFYEDNDSISRMIDNAGYFSIFTINEEQFAVVIDSSTKVYQQTPDGFKMSLRLPIPIGTSKVTLRPMDVNQDRFLDALLKIPTGGTAGDRHICLFFDPDRKQLVYDAKNELWNAQWEINDKIVYSQNRWSTTKFKINRFGFSKLEQRNDLRHTSSENKYENLVEVTKYNPENGQIISKDTSKMQNCLPKVNWPPD